MATWTDRVAAPLSLTRRGLLVLVDCASDAHLPTLLRHLRAAGPVQLCVELDDLWALPDRSTAILVVAPEHAAALNAARPRVASRELRVVLWSTRAMSATLLREAPDFFDWISHRVECPSGIAPHLLAGVEAARQVKIPGALVTGAERLDAESAEALLELDWHFVEWRAGEGTLERLSRLSLNATLWVEGVDDHATFRVELALSGYAFTAFVDARGLLGTHRSNGWWTLDGAVLPLAAALAHVRAVEPLVDVDAVALCGGERGAIDLMVALLKSGDDCSKVCSGVQRSSDAGAWLARRAVARGLINVREIALGCAPAPALRCFARSAAVRRAARDLRVEVESSLRAGALVDALRLGWFASRYPLPLLHALPDDGSPETAMYFAEALLRVHADRTVPPVALLAALIPNLPRLLVESLMARWAAHFAPGDVDRLLAAGTFEASAGDVRRAARLFAALCDTDRARASDDSGHRVLLARTLRLLGRYSEALIELHDLYLDRFDRDDLADACLEDARISIALCKPDAALASLRRAEKRADHGAGLRRQRAEIMAGILLLDGDATGALQALEGFDDTDAPLLGLRAEALLLADDGADARDVADRALERTSDRSIERANLLLTHARVLVDRGEFTGALLDVQRAEEIWSLRNMPNPHLQGRAHRIRGEALLRNGNHNAAEKAFHLAEGALAQAFLPLGVEDQLRALGCTDTTQPTRIDHPEFIEARLAWLAVPGRHEPRELEKVFLALRRRLRAGHPTVLAWEKRLRRRLRVAG